MMEGIVLIIIWLMVILNALSRTHNRLAMASVKKDFPMIHLSVVLMMVTAFHLP